MNRRRRKGIRREPGDGQLDSQQKGQNNDANFDQPGQPEPLIENGLHARSESSESSVVSRRPRDATVVSNSR